MYTTIQLKSIIHLFNLYTPVTIVNQDDDELYNGIIRDIPWKYMDCYFSYARTDKITDDNYAIDVIGNSLMLYIREGINH